MITKYICPFNLSRYNMAIPRLRISLTPAGGALLENPIIDFEKSYHHQKH
jgi:hypothetical protein